MNKQIIIDTDSGMDDIIAMCMILQSKNLNIKAINTVLGLVDPESGKENIKSILRYLNINIPIYIGAKYQLNRKRIKNKFPTRNIINSTKLMFLSEMMIGSVRQKKYTKLVISKFKDTTLLCLGPLTNIARLITKYGDSFTSKVNEVIIMGGSVFRNGNVGPSMLAEYNFYLDPEAAQIVFNSNLKITLVSMDSTQYVPATIEFNEKIYKLKPVTKLGKVIQKTISSNDLDFRYFYDPLAAAILIDPSIIESLNFIGLKVKSSGQSVVSNKTNKIKIITKINTAKFYKLLLESIK